MSGTGENLDGSRPLGFGEVYVGGKRVQVTHQGTHDLAQSRIGAFVEAGAGSGGNSIGRGRSVKSHNCLGTNGTFFPRGDPLWMNLRHSLRSAAVGRQPVICCARLSSVSKITQWNAFSLGKGCRARNRRI